ncbi:hypothetical protein [Streptomyces cyaneogriseus]|uniref:hypothetical protein n=1 Tax=Streptomyces cyaneogriseus TaxID=68192 RepID=UPI000A889D7D|nr:hypothetical protein [Streptomyces cyaneogriseus]
MSVRTVILFPGQGAYLPGVLAERVKHVPRAAQALEAIALLPGTAGAVNPALTIAAVVEHCLDHVLTDFTG